MAVETVADIGTVRHALHDAVHLPELLHLQTTQALCRGAVDRVQIAVLLLELGHLTVDILKDFQGKGTVLPDRLSVVQLLQLVERGDAKGSCHRLQKGFYLVRGF